MSVGGDLLVQRNVMAAPVEEAAETRIDYTDEDRWIFGPLDMLWCKI